MLKKLVWLTAAIVFAASIVINVLAFSGLLNPQTLVREKDQVIAEFTERVKTLESQNKALADAQRFLEEKLEKFKSASSSAKEELSRILEEYRRLKASHP